MEIRYCPICGTEGIEDKGMDEYECSECGDVCIEVWQYAPFRHS